MQNTRTINRVTRAVTRLNCTSVAKQAALSIVGELPNDYLGSVKVIQGEDGTRKRSVIISSGDSKTDLSHDMLDIEFSDDGVSLSMFIDRKYHEEFSHFNSIFRDRWGREVPHEYTDLWKMMPKSFWDKISKYTGKLS